MRFAQFVTGTTLAILAAFAAPALAGNVLYNFNSSDGGWTATSGTLTPTAFPWEWTGGPSANEGGWHAWRGIDPDGSGTFLESPCFIIDDVGQKYVRMDIRHRFDFGPAESPLALGQVQYRINGGTWLGIRTSDFLATSGKIPPSYSPPPTPPFIDTTSIPTGGPYNVEAWVGTTVKFDQGDHQDSQFTLDFAPSSPNPYPFGPGDEIQFRFLMGPLVDADPKVIDWEINKVQIDGVVECVPEPGGVTLAFAGGGLVLLGMARRRLRCLATFHRSAAAAVGLAVAVVAWVVLAAGAAKADAIFDFQLNDGGWTKSNQGVVPSSFEWTYFASGSSSDPRWSVNAMGVDGVTAATANHLTSPSVNGLVDGQPSVNARISIAHNFLLPPSGTGGPRPITLGQVSYRLNGSGPWIGLPLAAFTTGTGDVNADDPVFGPSPFNSGTASDPLYVDQTSFVPPTYLTPPSGTSQLPWVAPDGASFVGQSNGWSSLYVPSQAFLNLNSGLPLSGITSLELRLTNANLGGNCNSNEGWNVRMVQVDFSSEQPPVPEPGTLGLAVIGATGVFLFRARSRRRLRGRAWWQRVSPPALQPQ